MVLELRKVNVELLETSTDRREYAFNVLSGRTKWSGTMHIGPSVGKSFCFFRDDNEYMHTSKVKNIEYVGNDELVLTTQNSKYKLKIGESVMRA